MENQMIISISVIAILVIAFLIYIVWKIKKSGLKEFATEMIIKAEDMYKKGQNEEKINYVIDKIITILPAPLQIFITRETIRNFVQNVFDNIKKALDYVPKKEE